MRIRIALLTAFAVTCLTTVFFIAFGSTPGASAPRLATVPPPGQAAATAGPLLAGLNVPVLVHTPLGPVMDVGAAHFPVQPAPIAVPAAPVVVPVTDSTSTNTADWACIREQESGDRYNDPTAPSGAYGILISTWQSFGYSGWPYQAASSVQDALALRLYNEDGWAPWSSRYACGL